MKYFFSYSRHDSEFVKQLAGDLKKMNLNIWLDQLDIPVGARWDSCIQSALSESSGIILVLSRSSVQSDNVMDEVNFAITKNKHIIPILLDDCEVPFRIARIQQINFQGDVNYNNKIEDIIATIHAHNNTLQQGVESKVVDKPTAKPAQTNAEIVKKIIEEDATENAKSGTTPFIVEDITYNKPYVKPGNKAYVKPGNVGTDAQSTGSEYSSNPNPVIKTGNYTTQNSGNEPSSNTETYTPRSSRHYSAETRGSNTGYESPGILRRLMRVKFSLVLTLAIIIFLLWLFNSPSGSSLYASLSSSYTDMKQTQGNQFLPEIVIILIVGAIAGWLAGMFVNTGGQSLFVDIAIGIAGGVIAYKFIFHGLLALTSNYYANLTITATIGAIILALIINIVRGIVGK